MPERKVFAYIYIYIYTPLSKLLSRLQIGNFKKETESLLLVVAQNNIIRTNYTIAKIDNTLFL